MNAEKATSARLAATLCVLILIFGSCAKSNSADTSRAGSKRGTSAASTAPRKPGPRGTSGAATAAASPHSGIHQGTPKSVGDDPVATVSAFFAAMNDSDYVTQNSLTAGAAQVLIRVRDVIAQENAQRGASTFNKVTITMKPSLKSSNDTKGVVEVEAKVESEVSGPKGTLTSTDVFSGPVNLIRRDARWAITDLMYNDERLGASYYPVGASASNNGFTLNVAAVMSYKKTTAALIRITSDEGKTIPIELKPATLQASGKDFTQTQFAFEKASSPAGFLGFERIEGSPNGLKLTVTRGDNQSSWTFELAFDPAATPPSN